jgi:hypothetical protein
MKAMPGQQETAVLDTELAVPTSAVNINMKDIKGNSALDALTLFCIRVIIQIHQFLLKLATHGNNLPSTVRINPCLNLWKPPISLSQEVILKHIIYIFRFGRRFRWARRGARGMGGRPR